MRQAFRPGGKRQDIGGFVLVAEITIQTANSSIANEHHRKRLMIEAQPVRQKDEKFSQPGNRNPVPALTVQDDKTVHEELFTLTWSIEQENGSCHDGLGIERVPSRGGQGPSRKLRKNCDGNTIICEFQTLPLFQDSKGDLMVIVVKSMFGDSRIRTPVVHL